MDTSTQASARGDRRRRPASDGTRERIIAAAETLFGTRSYEQTKVADVAEAAGIATGSFYRHFGSKRELLVELLRQLGRDLRAAMRTAIGDATSQREIERRAFGAFFAFFHEHPYLFRIQRQTEFVEPAVHREYFEELARRYARGAKDAMLRDEVDPSFDPELLAYVYLGIAHFVATRWVEWTRGGTVPEDVAEQVYRILEKAMRPEDAS